jgi:hypothetical protein
MTPTEKAQLLQAVAEMTRVNSEKNEANFASIKNACRDAANLILESISEDFRKEKKEVANETP